MTRTATRVNRIAALVALLSFASSAAAQLVEYPLPSNREIPRKVSAGKRTQSIDPTFLPFWDDFSSSDTLLRDSLWLYGNSVLLNNGIGIQPPSKNVVTFDGVDSLGKPYNINDALAKGFADHLVSQPIRMDLVNPSERNTVYFSFFYELEGRGEPPDPGDELIVSFKNNSGTWEDIFILEPGVNMRTDSFTQVILPVAEERFFHANFQFRIYNLARLSGPYDTWNVDYIYLNRLRDTNDLYYPDRTISSPLSSLFHDYYAMPITHFLADPASHLTHPTVELYNLKKTDSLTGSPHAQPFKYTTEATITSRNAGTLTTNVVPLDFEADPGMTMPGLKFVNLSLNTLPAPSDFDANADSIHVRLKYSMTTKDNLPTSLLGDYNPRKYKPIDFRYSDTTSIGYVLSSYYAYDDGTAEYGAGLNQAGSFLAFLFEMKTDSIDTLVYVDIYFPEFGDNTNQSLQLQVRSTLGDINAAPLIDQLIVVERTTRNKFKRYTLYRPVPVAGAFYIGWKQITNASIPVGLDKNTENGNKIYYNITGDWVQNTLVKGSIMVRPGFGKGIGEVVTGVEALRKPVVLYPNPTTGICYVQGLVERAEGFDSMGRAVDTRWEIEGDKSRITLAPSASGLLIVRMVIDGQVHTVKVMVQAEGK